MIQKDIFVSYVHTVSHVNFEGVEFYAIRKYMNIMKEGI